MYEWIVVLNRTEARIFKRSKKSTDLEYLKTLKNPLGRIRNRAMQNDRPGVDQFRAKRSTIPHSMSGEKDPHEEAAVQFVRKVASFLNLEAKKLSYENLTIIADSHLMGILNDMLDKSTQRMIKTRIQKNLAKLSDHDIAEHLKHP